MSGMLACAPHNDVIVHDDVIKVEQNCSNNITTERKSTGADIQLSETAHRQPTVPGDFRKTHDPFLPKYESIIDLGAGLGKLHDKGGAHDSHDLHLRRSFNDQAKNKVVSAALKWPPPPAL